VQQRSAVTECSVCVCVCVCIKGLASKTTRSKTLRERWQGAFPSYSTVLLLPRASFRLSPSLPLSLPKTRKTPPPPMAKTTSLTTKSTTSVSSFNKAATTLLITSPNLSFSLTHLHFPHLLTFSRFSLLLLMMLL